MPRFGIDAADRWTRAAVPGWVPRGILLAGWVLAFALASLLDSPPCSVADPSVCGPDLGWSVGASMLLATPVLLLVLPALGCLGGVGFGLFELATEPAPVARIAFVLHGLACAGVLVRMLIGRRRQGEPARAGGGRVAVPGPAPRTGPVDFIPPALLLIPAAGLLLLWHHGTVGDERHQAAAVRLDAVVVAEIDDGWTVRLQLPDRGDEVSVDVVDSYPVGAVLPVLVDRTGAKPWVTLVAEPPDPTFPLAAGLGVVLLALATAGGALRRHRATAGLLAGAPAVSLLGLRRADEVDLWDADLTRSFGRIRIRWASPDPTTDESTDEEFWDEDELSAADAEDFGAAWREPADDDLEARFGLIEVPSRNPVPMVAVGDLRQGGWIALLDGTEVLWPVWTVQALRRTGDEEEWEPEDDGDLFRGAPIEPGPAAELPLTAGPPVRTRLLGAAMTIGAGAGPLAAAFLAENCFQVVVALIAGAGLLHSGLRRVTVGVRLHRDRLTVRETWWVHEVPWAAVHGARRNGGELRLAWRPDVIIDTGPFAPGDAAAAEQAERLGGAVMRQRALALAAGDPGRPPVARWNPAGVGAALLYLAAVVAAVLAR